MILLAFFAYTVFLRMPRSCSADTTGSLFAMALMTWWHKKMTVFALHKAMHAVHVDPVAGEGGIVEYVLNSATLYRHI